VACFHEGLDAFEHTCPVGGKLFAQFEQELLSGLNSEDETGWQKLLGRLHQQRNTLMSQLEAGRDRLLEISSRGTEGAEELADAIKTQDENPELAGFMLAIFDMFGIQQEDSDGQTLILRPTEHMLLPEFPGLTDDGVTVTFDRRVALAREDVQFLSWEHPMVYGAIELLLSSELGNNTVSLLPSSALPAGTMLVEAIFALQATAPDHFQLERYLPLTPIRLLLDAHGNNLADKVAAEGLEPQLKSVNKHTARKLVSASRSQLQAVLQNGMPLANEQARVILDAALSRLEHSLRAEQDRLQALQATNPSVCDEEVEYVRERRHTLSEALAAARVELDAVHLIVVAPSN
jgi:ATP-dependent helicase HepA